MISCRFRGVYEAQKFLNMFTHFTESQKELFWAVIRELPFYFDDSKREDITYLEMKIDNGQPLNKENQKVLRHSTLLLRLLKEIQTWKGDSSSEEDDEEFNKRKDELVEMLLSAETRKNNINK